MAKNYMNKPIEITVSIVFYEPTIQDLKQVACNIKRLNTLSDYHFTFFLIDNHSTKNKIDRSIFEAEKDNVKFIFLKHNVGFGQGHNQVIPLLNSDYHIIMNPDILVSDLTGFRKAINYMNNHNKVVLLTPFVRDQETREIQYLNRHLPSVFDLMIRFLGPWAFPRRQAWFMKCQTGYDHIQLEENATGSFMLLRTSAFKSVKGFDPRFFMYFEDTDLTRKLSRKGKAIMFPNFTVLHGWKRENHSLKGMWPMIHSMIQYFNKWGWKWF